MTEDQKLTIQKIVLNHPPWKMGDTFEDHWSALLDKVHQETGLHLCSLTTDEDFMPIEWKLM